MWWAIFKVRPIAGHEPVQRFIDQDDSKTVHRFYLFLQKHTKTKMENIAFCIITLEPIKVKAWSAPQNDRLNLSFVKDNYVDGGNLA